MSDPARGIVIAVCSSVKLNEEIILGVVKQYHNNYHPRQPRIIVSRLDNMKSCHDPHINTHTKQPTYPATADQIKT